MQSLWDLNSRSAELANGLGLGTSLLTFNPSVFGEAAVIA